MSEGWELAEPLTERGLRDALAAAGMIRRPFTPDLVVKLARLHVEDVLGELIVTLDDRHEPSGVLQAYLDSMRALRGYDEDESVCRSEARLFGGDS